MALLQYSGLPSVTAVVWLTELLVGSFFDKSIIITSPCARLGCLKVAWPSSGPRSGLARLRCCPSRGFLNFCPVRVGPGLSLLTARRLAALALALPKRAVEADPGSWLIARCRRDGSPRMNPNRVVPARPALCQARAATAAHRPLRLVHCSGSVGGGGGAGWADGGGAGWAAGPVRPPPAVHRYPGARSCGSQAALVERTRVRPSHRIGMPVVRRVPATGDGSRRGQPNPGRSE